jgi:hypothetical protein
MARATTRELRLHFARACSQAAAIGAAGSAVRTPLIALSIICSAQAQSGAERASLLPHPHLVGPAALANYVILGSLLGRQRARTALAIQARHQRGECCRGALAGDPFALGRGRHRHRNHDRRLRRPAAGPRDHRSIEGILTRSHEYANPGSNHIRWQELTMVPACATSSRSTATCCCAPSAWWPPTPGSPALERALGDAVAGRQRGAA